MLPVSHLKLPCKCINTRENLTITGLDLHFDDCDVGFGDFVLLQLVFGGGALGGLRRRVPLALVRFHVVVVSPATGVTGDPPPIDRGLDKFKFLVAFKKVVLEPIKATSLLVSLKFQKIKSF